MAIKLDEETQAFMKERDEGLLGGVKEALANQSSAFNEKLNSMTPTTIVEQKQAGALENIAKMEVWDIPVGAALLGGFTAVVASELIDGFLKNQSSMVKGVIKLVGAGVAIKWLPGFLGKTGAAALGLLLAYDGIRQILPIDEWASNLTGRVTTLTGGGLGGKAGTTNVRSNVVAQAQQVAADYYKTAEGR